MASAGRGRSAWRLGYGDPSRGRGCSPRARFFTTLMFVQTPPDRAAAGDEQENEAVKHGHFALVHRREEIRPELELPMELKIRHGHRAAAEKSRQSRLEPDQHQNPADQFDDPTEPSLRHDRRFGVIGKCTEQDLHAVEGEHRPRHDPHQRISVVRVFFERFHHPLRQFYCLTSPLGTSSGLRSKKNSLLSGDRPVTLSYSPITFTNTRFSRLPSNSA